MSCKRICRLWALAIAALVALFPASVLAQRHAAPVPPTLEIEVLDPGVDPLGNPAVTVTPDLEDPGQYLVDIPPTVVVHRHYYSGDRSFQGPMLPGGPSILVMNHPRTGERCYVSAQMLPGAPRVTYRSHSIDFDYGENGITVHFGMFGAPSLKYRSGKTWGQKTSAALHTEQLRNGWQKVKEHSHTAAQRGTLAGTGLLVEIREQTKIVTLPAQNLVRLMPFGAALTSGDVGPQLAERAIEHERSHRARHAEREQAWEQLDIRTIR